MQSHYNAVASFPLLTQAEFQLACHHFENAYLKAFLGDVRRKFVLRMNTSALDPDVCWIKILKPIILESKTVSDQNTEDLVELMERLGWADRNEVPTSTVADTGFGSAPQVESTPGLESENVDPRSGMDTAAEDADMDLIHQPKRSVSLDSPPSYTAEPVQPYVVYEIHYHPIYRMPYLVFTLHHLPPQSPISPLSQRLGEFDIDSVYQFLVPQHLQSVMRSGGFGVGGAITVGPNPVTELHSFVLHPCQTQEAMMPWREHVDLGNYLMIWLGITGGPVGLEVPTGMATAT